LCCVGYNIIEEDYVQGVESRGIDAGHEVVQIFGDPLEGEISENGKDRAY
jgi:hypothetical protein